MKTVTTRQRGCSPRNFSVALCVYIENEQHFAKTKAWYDVFYKHFEHWATKSDISWRAIKPHLDDAMEKARNLWPNALNDLPMNEEHKQHLREHWQRLHEDFRI